MCVGMCVSALVHVCVHVYVCMHVYTCMCVCAHVRMCARVSKRAGLGQNWQFPIKYFNEILLRRT